MLTRLELQHAAAVQEYAEWYYKGRKSKAPNTEGLPSIHTLFVDDIRVGNCKPIAWATLSEVAFHLKKEIKIPFAPVVAKDEAAAAAELHARRVNGSRSSGSGAGGGPKGLRSFGR